jgi:2-keto-3-deoxy-L-rhamnonate aldolase RhmA
MNSHGTFAETLHGGGALGCWSNFASFACVELMTSLGFDFVVLDMQHSEITRSHFPSVLGAFSGAKCFSVVRAAANDYHLINWLCDMGVDGVLVPMVNSAEDARRAVQAAKYPPVGRRSFGPLRAARYGSAMESYMERPDSHTALIVQIEDARAAENAHEIVAVAGVDAVFVGPNDIAFSMLKQGERVKANPGEWTAFARTPEVLGLCALVMERARQAGIPFGMTAGSYAEAHDWLRRGASFATYGSDFMFLRAGAQHLCRPAISEVRTK